MHCLYEICPDYIKYALAFFKNIVLILVLAHANTSKNINHKIITHLSLARLLSAP